ncbi:MAG: oligosaccharide flippase family protein [Blastochloris sp.]|nr:oligosaccharide flippase family protein [Blastochloris sp.]
MSLRERALKGGTYLLIRQGLSMAISLVGVLTITWLIGAYDYGVYAAVWNLTSVIAQIGKVGLDVYLVRGQENPSEQAYHQAFSFLLVSGVLIAVVGILLAPLIAHWLQHDDYLNPLRATLLMVPVIMLTTPAVAQLDRDLNYRKIATIEIVGQLLFYVAAIPLAVLNYGPWSLVAGLMLWQTWALGANYVAVRYRPRWHWSTSELREMLKYGLSYSSANWIWRMRPLVNTLIVGRFLSPEGVGIVALALRLVDVLSFVRASLWRLALAVLAKVQDDIPRLRRALEESMGIQVLSLGPLVAGLALVAPWLLPRVFGDEWSAVPQIYPFVALSALMHGVFNMHISVLYVLKRNNDVSLFYMFTSAF